MFAGSDRFHHGRHFAPRHSAFCFHRQVIGKQILRSLCRHVSQLPHAEFVLDRNIGLIADYAIDYVGRNHAHVLRQQRILGPYQDAAPLFGQMVPRAFDKLRPRQAAILRSVRPAGAFDACIVNLVGRDKEILHSLGRFDDVVVHGKNEIVGTAIEQVPEICKRSHLTTDTVFKAT